MLRRLTSSLIFASITLPLLAAKPIYSNSLSITKPKISKPKKQEKIDAHDKPKAPALPLTDPSPGAYTKISLQDLYYKPHLDTGYQPIKLEASLTEPVSVDLEYVLVKALEDNINLNISRESATVAKWKFWQQFSEMLPDFTVAARKKSLDGTFFLNSQFQSVIDETQAQMQLRVSYRAFSGGKTTFLTIAENFYRTAAGADEQDQYNLVLLKSLEFYNELLKDQVKLSTKLKALAEAEASLDQSRKFYKAGVGTKFDVLQAEARMARAQQEMIEQEARYRVSEINLSEHLNLPLLTPLHALENEITGIAKLSLVQESLTIEDFIKTARKNNPRVQAALKRKRGAFQEGLAKAGDLLPKLDIYADHTGTGQEFGELNNITTLGFETSLELGKGSGVTTFADIMGARALARKAKLLFDQEQLRIEKELRFAFLNFEKAKSVLFATEIELIASREALHLSRLRYENGLEVLATVIKRESDLAEVESKAIDSIASYNLAQAQILYLMGTISQKDLLAKS